MFVSSSNELKTKNVLKFKTQFNVFKTARLGFIYVFDYIGIGAVFKKKKISILNWAQNVYNG